MAERPTAWPITLVAAMGRDRVIGADGKMPWHLPADLAHFKRVTLGHPVVMGRKTFESIGAPLPGRTNIVLSRSRPELPDGVLHASGLEQALELAADSTGESDPIMVIGGGQVYAQALPLASVMELSFVDADPEGDTRFPEWSRRRWKLVATEVRPADDKNPYRLVFCRFERVAPD